MKKLIAILLCAALAAGLFAGCEMANTPEGYIPTGDALENAVIPQEEEAQEETNQMTLALQWPCSGRKQVGEAGAPRSSPF